MRAPPAPHASPTPPRRVFANVYGVDFSGAKLAGRNAWLAHGTRHAGRLRLVRLVSLESLASDAARAPALAALVREIVASGPSLWGIDAPFSLPVELLGPSWSWRDVVSFAASFAGDAPAFGRFWLERARSLGGRPHLYRATDRAAKAPFDCYHYRIIYQTFHALRDVLGPLSIAPDVIVAPFDAASLTRHSTVVVETCPSSTLKRLGLPHKIYKQPAGGRLTAARRRNRLTILGALAVRIDIGEREARAMLRNPGGDALDSVIALIGTDASWRAVDHRAIAADTRAVREGFIYA